jgi:hypothetical protein
MSEFLTIKINLHGNVQNDLSFRYIIADTIEARGIGTIINEGAGNGYVDIGVKVDNFELAKNQIMDLLCSLNLDKYSDIYNHDD